MPASTWRVAAALVVITLIWGTTWAAIRVGLEGIPPFTAAAMRFALAGLLLLALVPVLGVKLGTRPREKTLWAVNALGTFTISYGIVYWGEQYISSGLTAVLFTTFPLGVALLAHFFLPGERLTLTSVAGVLLGFVGVVVIFSEDLRHLKGPLAGKGPGVATAAAVVLVAPTVAAVANVAVKRWGKGIHPLSLTAVPMLLASALLGLAAFATERGREITFDGPAVGSLLYLAVCGSAVTFTLYFWLLDRLPAGRLALFNYAVPVVAVITGALAFGETVTHRLALGAGLILLGCAAALGRRSTTD